jgi:phosphatidylinositol glycan class S
MGITLIFRSESPLHIMDSDNKILETNAFLVPRWGGVAIQNIEEVNK